MQQFLNHVIESKLFKASDKILLAVSGGMDSMVMLNLFLTAGYSIGVAHCNFQLRGDESDGDEAFIKQVCSDLKIPFFVKRFLTNAHAEQNGLSIQVAARELRYAWFTELVLREDYDLLATAHHLNDNLETVLMNFIRGTGLSGVCGIPERKKNVIRPLLTFSRKQLQQYAAEQHLSWREDSSNESNDYQRNFVRHHLVPLMAEMNPNLDANFLKTLKRFKASQALVQAQLQAIRNQFVVHQKKRTTISKSFAAKVEYPSQVLWELIKVYGFNGEQCDEIILAMRGIPGKRFLSEGHELYVDREALILTEVKEFWSDVLIMENQDHAKLGDWNLTISVIDAASYAADAYQATLDCSKIQFPLTWRPWKKGDSFFPLGMKGRKKISDFLINQKVPRPDKESVTVLESGGEIIWVVGYRIDDRFKVTSDTNHALRLLVEPFFV